MATGAGAGSALVEECSRWHPRNVELHMATPMLHCTLAQCKLDTEYCRLHNSTVQAWHSKMHCTTRCTMHMLHCTLHQNLVVVTHTSSLGNNQHPATPRHLYDSCHFSYYFTELFCIIFSRLLQLCHPIQDCSRVVFFIFVLWHTTTTLTNTNTKACK